MVHDGEGNLCTKSEGSIMSPTLAGRNGLFSWSACSRQYLRRFLRYDVWGLAVCLSSPLMLTASAARPRPGSPKPGCDFPR